MGILEATLGASLLENMLAGKNVLRAGEETIRINEGTVRAAKRTIRAGQDLNLASPYN